MASSSSNTFLLSAADVSWGRRECNTVQITLAAAALSAKFFTMDVPDGADFGSNRRYYIWFDLAAGSADPNPGGDFTGNGIEVDIVTGDTAAEVAVKVQLILEAEGDFRAEIDSADSAGETVILEAEFKGPVDNVAADVDSASVIVQRRSGIGADLGKTSGGVEVTMETTSVVINSDQTGALVLDEVLTGQTVEASMSFLEMTAERWETIVGSVTGDNFTPSGGSLLTGFGESRLYASLLDLGGELVLHPTRLAASDRSKNITFWKSAPKPASVNFSGEEPQVMEVSFSALADPTIEEAIRIMAFGDNEQDVRA